MMVLRSVLLALIALIATTEAKNGMRNCVSKYPWYQHYKCHSHCYIWDMCCWYGWFCSGRRMMEDGGETDLPAEDFKDPMTPMFIKNMMKDFADSLEASGADGEKLVEEYGAASPMDLFDKMILDEESVMKKVMDGDRATFSFGPSDMASKALNLVPYVIVAVVSALLTFAAITMSKKRSSVGTYDEISPLAV